MISNYSKVVNTFLMKGKRVIQDVVIVFSELRTKTLYYINMSTTSLKMTKSTIENSFKIEH